MPHGARSGGPCERHRYKIRAAYPGRASRRTVSTRGRPPFLLGFPDGSYRGPSRVVSASFPYGIRMCGKPYTRARARLQRQGPSIYFQNNYFATLAAILAKEITDENQKGRARSRHSRFGRRECPGAGLGDAEKNQGHRRHFAGPPRIVDPVFLL
ncbi:hypothetical protein PSP6_100013 [Paraburkholderia tropica]|nr:hypothetical protein PSP6_100013 [Paraburkholderia tropica]